MKNLIIIICAFTLSIPVIKAQGVVMTFTAGVSPQHNPEDNHIFVNRSSPRDEFTFDLAQVPASFVVGVGARYNLQPFFIAAEAQYNKREFIYDVSYTYPTFARSETKESMSEQMNIINLPVTLGVDLGIVDITSGFVPQLVVTHKSELSNIDGYSEKVKPIRLGWQSGVAANIKQLRVGVSWQMDFNNYADHAYINNQNLSLQGRANRWLGTVSYMF